MREVEDACAWLLHDPCVCLNQMTLASASRTTRAFLLYVTRTLCGTAAIHQKHAALSQRPLAPTHAFSRPLSGERGVVENRPFLRESCSL